MRIPRCRSGGRGFPYGIEWALTLPITNDEPSSGVPHRIRAQIREGPNLLGAPACAPQPSTSMSPVTSHSSSESWAQSRWSIRSMYNKSCRATTVKIIAPIGKCYASQSHALAILEQNCFSSQVLAVPRPAFEEMHTPYASGRDEKFAYKNSEMRTNVKK